MSRRGHSRFWSPVQAIVQFLIYTGARPGEVLHAEWSDFNLTEGYWMIHHKPNCPTADKLGVVAEVGKIAANLVIP